MSAACLHWRTTLVVCAVVLCPFVSLYAQPVNNNCANAITIGNGTHSFSTAGATTDGPSHGGTCPPGNGNTWADIWYRYTATCSGDLTLDTCGTVNYDSDVVIYDGCDCNNLELLGCNDDGPFGECPGFSSRLTVSVIAGNCYLLRVGGYNSNFDQGSGTFSLSCGEIVPLGACCLPGGACDQRLEEECTSASGSFQGVFSPCLPNPCSGACCFNDGTCLIAAQSSCESQGGEYSADLDCSEVTCSGACCLDENTCQTQSALDCDGLGGEFFGIGSVCSTGLCTQGPDVVYSDINGITTAFGPVGGFRAYALGSDTCNVGNQNLIWADNGTPGLAMNMYRLHGGRLEQIGLGWLKTACCAGAGPGCGLPCNGAGGNVLGAGCLDVYSAGWNSGQSALARRSSVNGFTAQFSGAVGASGSAIAGLMQVAETDMNAAAYPGALYFVEGHYLATDDAATNHAMNNASYGRVTIGGSFNLSLASATQVGIPAIYAWRDHGGGANVPDPAVQITEISVPAEGRFIVAAKSLSLGNGLYRYTYSIHNFNSDRAGGSFRVPLPAGVNVTDVGFHDARYHSGDPYDNTDWTSAVTTDAVTWSSPQTFAQNANSNALRYGTMYTFWFTADAFPADTDATLGLFKPGTPSSLDIAVPAPGCTMAYLGDVNEDGAKDGIDVSYFTDCIVTGESAGGNCACANMNMNEAVEMTDIALIVAALLAP